MAQKVSMLAVTTARGDLQPLRFTMRNKKGEEIITIINDIQEISKDKVGGKEILIYPCRTDADQRAYKDKEKL
jgi:hypothetical protein